MWLAAYFLIPNGILNSLYMYIYESHKVHEVAVELCGRKCYIPTTMWGDEFYHSNLSRRFPNDFVFNLHSRLVSKNVTIYASWIAVVDSVCRVVKWWKLSFCSENYRKKKNFTSHFDIGIYTSYTLAIKWNKVFVCIVYDRLWHFITFLLTCVALKLLPYFPISGENSWY